MLVPLPGDADSGRVVYPRAERAAQNPVSFAPGSLGTSPGRKGHSDSLTFSLHRKRRCFVSFFGALLDVVAVLKVVLALGRTPLRKRQPKNSSFFSSVPL